MSEDLLYNLIRVRTKTSTKEVDIALESHISKCTTPAPCPYENCDRGKTELVHYNSCRDPECFKCVFARLVRVKTSGIQSPPDLVRRFLAKRGELQDELKNLRRAANGLKSAPDDVIVQLDVELSKQGYTSVKQEYTKLCAEVFEFFKMLD